MQPFSSDIPLFEQDPAAARILEQLVQQLQHGEQLLLLCGPTGSGRTALLTQLVERVNGQRHVCRIEPTGSGAMLLLRFARCLGLTSPHSELRQLFTQLQRHLSSSPQIYPPLLIIDDAHQLSDAALQAVVLLAQLRLDGESRLPVVLAADSGLHARLQQPEFSGRVTVQRYELQPYSQDTLANYLRYHLGRAGHDGNRPFSRRELRLIERESGGWPGQINRIASELLRRSPQAARPYLRRLAWGGLALVVLASGWYFYSGRRVAPENVAMAGVAAAPTQDVQPPLSPAPTDDGAEQPEDAPLQELTATEDTLIPTTVNLDTLSRSAGGVSMHGSDWVVQQPRQNFTLQLMASSQAESLYKLVDDKQLPAPLAVVGLVQGEKRLYVLLQGSYASRSAAEEQQTRLTSVLGVAPWLRRFDSLPSVSEVPQQPLPAVQAKPVHLIASGLRGAVWLWTRQPDHYTLQLYSDPSESALLAYVARQKLGGELGWMRVEHGGRSSYLLVSGDYPDSAAASRALAALPTALQAASPRLLSFASLQDEMMRRGRNRH